MRVIGVAGQFRNGKDEVADYIAERLNWPRDAFAKSVKRVFSETFDVSLEFIEEWKTKDECPPGFDMPIRQGLQFIGDGFRKIQGDIWIELAFRNRTDDVILSDSRYVNELKKIRDLQGINILVYRPGFINDDPNGSEARIRPFVEYFVDQGIDGVFCPESTWRLQPVPEEMGLVDIFLRNDAALDDLYAKVDDIVLPYVHDKWKTITD